MVKDCNIDQLVQDEDRGLYVRDNFFDRPLEERWADFEKRLAQALAARDYEVEINEPERLCLSRYNFFVPSKEQHF